MTQRPSLTGQRVMVTGGAGFIGSHLVDRLMIEGVEEVVVVDNLFLGEERNLERAQSSGRLHFYRDDVELASSLHYIFERHAIDTVFHAATKPLNYSFLNPTNSFSSNVTMVLNLLECQRRGAFRTLCQFSTSEVYGNALYEPMDENHPRRPTTTYAGGKAAADLAVENYVSMFDVDAYIVRPFNNYGPRQNWRGPLAGVIPITIARILDGESPEVHGDGEQSRDFIHVFDTVDAIVKLDRVMPPGESVNISTNNCIAVGTLVKMICKGMGYSGEIVRKPARSSDVLWHNASNEKARSMIDYRLTPFEKGLRDTIQWYRQRRDG